MARSAAVVAVLAIGLAAWWWYPSSVDVTDVRGKRVVITGSSLGIGRDTAFAFARAGAKLILAARSRDKLQAVADKCVALGAQGVLTVVGDLGTVQGVQAVVDNAREGFGGMDILILNHVVGMWQEWGDNSDPQQTTRDFELLQTLFRVNTFSYIHLATLALPQLKASHGNIVVVSSLAAQMGLAKVSVYAATKHALHGFFDSLRVELGMHGSDVTVSIVSLGNIDTASNREKTKHDIDHIKRNPSAEAAAAVMATAIRRPREVYYPYIELVPILFIKNFFPGLADWLVTKVLFG